MTLPRRTSCAPWQSSESTHAIVCRLSARRYTPTRPWRGPSDSARRTNSDARSYTAALHRKSCVACVILSAAKSKQSYYTGRGVELVASKNLRPHMSAAASRIDREPLMRDARNSNVQSHSASPPSKWPRCGNDRLRTFPTIPRTSPRASVQFTRCWSHQCKIRCRAVPRPPAVYKEKTKTMNNTLPRASLAAAAEFGPSSVDLGAASDMLEFSKRCGYGTSCPHCQIRPLLCQSA